MGQDFFNLYFITHMHDVHLNTKTWHKHKINLFPDVLKDGDVHYPSLFLLLTIRSLNYSFWKTLKLQPEQKISPLEA